MKNKYLSNRESGHLGRLWVFLVMVLLALPFIGQAQSITVSPSTDPDNPTEFGTVPVGQVSSPAKQYAVTATGISGNLTVSFGNAASFEGSTDNSNFSNAVVLPAAGGTLYVRFKPTAVGTTNGEYIQVTGNTDGRNGTTLNAFIDVRGTGAQGLPTLTATPSARGFGNQVINTTSSPMTFTVTGTSLTGDVTVTAPAGFLVSNSATGTYNQTTTVGQGNTGSVNETVYVVFNPTVASNYVGNVTFTSSGTSTTASVAGTGVLPPATLSVTPTSLTFADTQEGLVSSPSGFTVSGSNLTAVVTVTAPTGFLIRQGTTGTFVQTVTLTPVNNSVNASLQAVFAPATAGSYSSNITISSAGNGNPSINLAVSGTATSAPRGPFIVVNPGSLDFQTVSSSGSAQTLSFEINAGNLTAPLVLTGSNNNILFREAALGGSFVNGPITINPVSGSVSSRIIEVQLTGPIGAGEFTGNITASSTGAASRVVSITANSTGGESVVNVSSSGLNLFSTVPGVPSAVQSYQLSGTNLLRDITVTAPPAFQVSLDANFTNVTTTNNTIVVPRNNGSDVTPTTVYVRFVPTSAFSTSGSVLNSSRPALGVAVRVQGTSEPSIQLQNAFQQVKNVEIYTRSSSQAITVVAERVLQPVTISQLLSANTTFNPDNTAQFEISRDNVNFTIDTVKLKPNTSTYSINQQIYIRFRPTNLGSAQATLRFQSNDFDDKTTQNFTANSLLSGLPIDNQPSLRATANVVRNNTTATVSFTLPANYAGLGYGEGRLIVASENPTLPSGNQPSDGISYQTGNQIYGQGPQVAPGYFAVFAGPNASVTIEGLDIRKTYYFYTFEYNNIDNNVNVIASGAENYLSPPTPNTIPGIIAPSPLPVTLVSFDAKVRGSQVALTWVTSTELNNKGFEVERSRDGRSFETILFRAGKGTTSSSSTYTAADEKPLAGTSYYRLKQIDLDGTVSHTQPVVVNFLRSGDVNMYPNPVEDILTIELGGTTEGVTVTITDSNGRLIRSQKLGANGTLNMGDLGTGTYMVTVGEGNSKVTRRIVKK
ncbi:T9SS type A sorting domain-containing protein [Hymenobacter sp. DG01]|uniref:T9SS type A sorting domain-containing protein n=1 Tax=Hymenobacter sp. DG01 TaxID=2584940 RepID=UPI0011205D51|nr:T9SS type A sorting domain-containing protein [Hymenobacter sp. DG01]